MEAQVAPLARDQASGGLSIFLRRVSIRNYKSVGKADVELSPLTILVGRNGSGKSNFLDALRFVTESLQTSMDHAIKSRGGIDSVRRRSTGHPRNFAISLELLLPGYELHRFRFEVTARERGGFQIAREELEVLAHNGDRIGHYAVRLGNLEDASIDNMPPAFPDRLYLVTASGYRPFRSSYDALSSMGFYNLNPDAIKELQSPDAGELLHRDGANLASVVARLANDQPEVLERVQAYLGTIVPGISEIDRVSLGPRETLQFKQKVIGATHPWKFYAASMSDGTLRALGTLIAVTQLSARVAPVALVGIEEPETALHPAACGALMDALREASRHTQVLVTTHSPDLLDQVRPEVDGLLAVLAREGTTFIAPIDEASRAAIRDHLYSPGELLRLDQLEPDLRDLGRQEQLDLFGSADEEP